MVSLFLIAEGEKSTNLSVDSGVPQGSVLGPSLILYYVSDIPAGFDSTIRLFADDTIVTSSMNSYKLIFATSRFAKAMLKGV
jgi:hypothetical protein